jgi:hypothetical protein
VLSVDPHRIERRDNLNGAFRAGYENFPVVIGSPHAKGRERREIG